MKYTIPFLFLFLSLISFGQGRIQSKSINSVYINNNVSCNYSTTFKYQLVDAGYGESPTALKMGFVNTTITEITFKGYKATEILNELSFPIKAKLQANVNGSVFIKKGSINISTNFNESAVSDGGLDTFDFTKNFTQQIFSSFGKEVTYNDVTPKATNIKLSNIALNKFWDIKFKMDTKIRALEKEKANKKKKQKNEVTKKRLENKSTSNSKITEVLATNNKNSFKNTPRETIYQKKQRLAKEASDRKRKREKENLDAANKFIEGQNRKMEIMEKGFDDLQTKLTNQIETIFSNMEKERNFNSKISSLTSIKSTSISSIISESKEKSRAINSLYNKRSNESLNDVAQKGAQLIGSSKNETELAISTGATLLTSALTKNKIEKDKREAQKRLEAEKKAKINKLVTLFKNKIIPVKNKYKNLAAYAISAENEEYYVKQYKYYSCIINNAYSAMQSKADCIEPNKKSINSYKSYTGVNYYNTYKRKAKSNIDFIKPNAEYFLDLAIEKEPENAEWIYDKAKFAELSLYNYEKAIILKKANQIAPSNLKIKKAYDNAFKRVQFFEKAKIMAIKNHIEKRTDYNWNSHSNLMRYSYNNKQVFLDSIGNVVLDLGDKYYFSNNRFYNNNDEFNNGLLKVRTQVNQKSNNNRNGTSIVQSSYYSSKNSRYGFLDTNGKMKIENKYHDASSFSEGLAAVKDPITNNWGYIDNKGNIKIPFTYNKAQKFSEGLAFIKKTIRDEKYILGGNLLRKGKYKAAYINKNNEVIISEKFDTGTPFKNGLAKVTKYATNDSFMGGGSDKTYYIDNTGKRINKKNYDRVKPYNNKGFAVVGNEKLARGMRWFIVNRNGEKQHKGTFENEPKFINGIAKVNIGGLINRKYVNIDDTGKIIIEDEKDNIEDSKKIIKELSKTQSVSELETLLKSNFDIVNKSGNGYRIKKGENYGFINNKGDIIIPVEYKRLGFFHNGLAVYTKKSKGAFKKCGYISEIGNVVVKEKYGECGDFSESTAVVAKVSLLGRKVGYININGKTIIPFKFYTGTSFKNGRAQVNDGNFNKPNVYFINTKGQKIN